MDALQVVQNVFPQFLWRPRFVRTDVPSQPLPRLTAFANGICPTVHDFSRRYPTPHTHIVQNGCTYAGRTDPLTDQLPCVTVCAQIMPIPRGPYCFAESNLKVRMIQCVLSSFLGFPSLGLNLVYPISERMTIFFCMTAKNRLTGYRYMV